MSKQDRQNSLIMNYHYRCAIISTIEISTTLLYDCKTRVCGHKVTKTRLAKGLTSPLNPWRGYITMSENKTKLVKVRMTEKEFDQLKYFSEITNQNMSEFVRNLIENRQPKIIKDLPISKFKILNFNLAKLGNYQVKLNRDFLNYIAQYPDNLISLEELLKVKENLENSRMNLLREISETKVILSEILKELR